MKRRRRSYRTDNLAPTHLESGDAREERPKPEDDTRCLRRRKR